MGTLKHDLRKPGVDLIETHASWVFLGPETVWKVKKPVDFGFLNFTTRERRKSACDAELALNRRLAPNVYRAVVPITRDASGTHTLSGRGEVVDYAVEMTRLADAQRADVLLEAELLSVNHVETLGRSLAAFHSAMPTSERISGFGSPEVILANVRENFSQTRDTIHHYLEPEQAREVEARQVGFVEQHRDLFIDRMITGKIRDGHGDLRLEHVYLGPNPEPTIIDCIEFNERFRYADVCSDIAFLTMDLADSGRVDLSEQLLATYASAADDFELYRLIDFYEGYRAFVRGKVASLLVEDLGAAVETRQRASQLARRHFLLALASGRQAVTTPALIAIGGIIGSGKSTLAARLGAVMTAPIVATDRTRKHALGIAPTTWIREGAWTGVYAPEFSERVYGEVLRRAASVLASGRPVIVDGSFRSREQRGRARLLARQMRVPFLFVECRATPEQCRARLSQRAQESNVSDARVDLFDDFVKQFESVDDLAPEEHVTLDTSTDVEASLRKLEVMLPCWPPPRAGSAAAPQERRCD